MELAAEGLVTPVKVTVMGLVGEVTVDVDARKLPAVAVLPVQVPGKLLTLTLAEFTKPAGVEQAPDGVVQS